MRAQTRPSVALSECDARARARARGRAPTQETGRCARPCLAAGAAVTPYPAPQDAPYRSVCPCLRPGVGKDSQAENSVNSRSEDNRTVHRNKRFNSLRILSNPCVKCTCFSNSPSGSDSIQCQQEDLERSSGAETSEMFRSKSQDSEELIKELCVCNGLNFDKIIHDGPATKTLEMFFSGYHRMVGLSYFPNLTVLMLVGQNIQRIAGLESCSSLQELWIAECHLVQIEGLQHCLNLEKLYLYHNCISAMKALDSLIQLKVLWLSDNEIKVIEGLSTLQNLKDLNLAGNAIHSIGNSLDANVQLERLNLSGNKISSFKELTNLSRLPKLKDLSLKDPQYNPNSICLLCNYATHVLYHIPQLQRLDTLDVSAKQAKDLAEFTVLKKKMYYNMRMKTVQRQLREELEKLNEQHCKAKHVPEHQMRALTFLMKNLERELSELQLSGQTHHRGNETQVGSEESQLKGREETSKDESNLVEKICLKIQSLKQRIAFWTQKRHDSLTRIEAFNEREVARRNESFDLLVQFLQIELETVGNVRFEDGSPSDYWFKICYDLIFSRFCALDFKAFGISGVKINRVIRVHNRILKLKFEDKCQEFLDNEDTWASENYKKMLDYLFYIFDPKFPVQKKELLQVLEDGCRVIKKPELCEQEQSEAVLLSNSLSLCEGPRLEFLQTQATSEKQTHCDPELFKYGKLVIAKVFLGRSVQAHEELPIRSENYHMANSVFRPRESEQSPLSSSNDEICTSLEHENCDCSLRQCEWFVFEEELVLPEYVVEYEYITMPQPASPSASTAGTEDEAHELTQDEDIITMEPIRKPRPKIPSLDEILSAARAKVYSQITVLNLHGSSLTKVRGVSRLSGLRTLVLSFNDLSSLEDISNLANLEYLDVSYNHVITLGGLKGLGKLKHLDLSWNQLYKTREEIKYLHKHTTQLQSLDLRHNPWHKPALVRKTAIGRLRSLTHLDGALVTQEELAETLQFFEGSKINQVSLLMNSRTDNAKPRCLSLFPSAQILSQISKNCLDPHAELNSGCYSMITSVNFDGQNLTKISNLEKLQNLRWASFSNNYLLSVEGLEQCVNLEELCLDGNCLTKLDGLSQLVKLQRLSLNNNQLPALDRDLIDRLPHLHYLSAEKNNITSLSAFQKAHVLIELYLSNNKISSNQELYYLKGLGNLVILDLYGNLITWKHDSYRLFVIFHLSTIKALDGVAVDPAESENAKDLFGGRLTSDMVAERMGHQNFTELYEINWRTSAIRTVDLIPVDLFHCVHTVDLQNNNLTSFSGLIYLPNIKTLNLNHNHVESILPQQKSQIHLTNRQILHQKVNSSGYGQQGAARTGRDSLLGETLTPLMQSLEILHLDHNGISNLPLLQLSRLQNLKSLFLQGNEISQVEGLEGLQLLQELALNHNRIKLISESAFTRLESLLVLGLQENRLRDLSNLLPLTRLKKLLIAFNRIQEISEVEKLEAIPSLLELSVYGNPFSRKVFHRHLLVLRLQTLQILDGVRVTAEERARAEMHVLEQQMQSAANAPVDVAHPVPSLILNKPPSLRVTTVCLSGAMNHSGGGDLHFNNAHEDILANEANRYKKSKHHVLGMTNNPRSVHAEIAFRQLRGAPYLCSTNTTPQNSNNQAAQTHPQYQDHEGRVLGHGSLRQHRM